MIIDSIDFLVFFTIVFLFLLIMPKSWRIIWMLAAGFFFFMTWNPINVVFLVFTIMTTYLVARYIENKKSKLAVSLVVVVNVLIILIGKFFGVIALPIGISFYTLQALGYVIDVYRRKSKPEKNILKYALFVSFFPIIQSGPIERSTGLLKQISGYHNKRIFSIDRIKSGLWLVVWGLFHKLVVANRASIFVENVYGNLDAYGTIEIILASVLFSVEIYCDFFGYSSIAIGIARILGFDVMQNFRQPYLATSIKDFWRRWHISLTSWFTEYIYISLGGNRKGIIRKYINILLVFGISGIWHGKSMNFLVWGGIHAIFQILGDFKERYINAKVKLPKFLQIMITLAMVNFAWIFFAADGFRHALRILKHMCVWKSSTSMLEAGLVKGDFFVLLIGCLIIICVDILHEKNVSVIDFVEKRFCIIRWGIYSFMFLMIIILGIYGVEYDTSTFMYIQF